MDLTQDPLQGPVSSLDPVSIKTRRGDFELTPVAKYRLSGKVVSKKTYSGEWEGKVSPVDLAIVWGKLAEPEYAGYVTFWQTERWYHYRLERDSPVDLSYVMTHSGNNHIIPASENVRRALRTIRKKDEVRLEGFLVNVKGTYNGRPVTWNTSLVRTDTGDGSCELFYVSKMRIGIKVYE